MLMKQFIVIIFSMLLSIAVFSQVVNITSNPIVTIFPMLQTDYDIRNIGLGAISAVNPSHDYTSLSLTNPALFVAGNKQMSNYVNFHQFDQNEYSLSYQAALKINNKYSIGLMGRNYSNTSQYVSPQNDIFNIDIDVMTIGGFLGYKINDHWSIGGGVNYLKYQIDTFLNINTYYFDIGLNYNRTFNISTTEKLSLEAGLKVNYLGPKPTPLEFLPTNLALATALTYSVDVNGGVLYTTMSYQAEKLLIPSNDFMDISPNNGILDWQEMSAAEGVLTSFSDASKGIDEELQEIIHKLGLELFYEKNGWTRGLRAGFFNVPEYKGGMKYRSYGASFGKNGYLMNFSYQHMSNVDPDVEVRDVLSLGLSMNI